MSHSRICIKHLFYINFSANVETSEVRGKGNVEGTPTGGDFAGISIYLRVTDFYGEIFGSVG